MLVMKKDSLSVSYTVIYSNCGMSGMGVDPFKSAAMFSHNYFSSYGFLLHVLVAIFLVPTVLTAIAGLCLGEADCLPQGM